MRSILFFILSVISISLYSQSIVVNPAGAPESALGARDLTFEVLMDGSECTEISNFTFKDNPQAQFPNANRSWGYFEKGTSDFPFESGILLTSGYAQNANGPSGGVVSDGAYSWTGDPDIEYLMNLTTNFHVDSWNATIFEFDFVPLGNEISFNYIFASEEYDPLYACSDYNDAFAFIISGPGITADPGLTGKNIALLPNGDYVTINNVNNQYCGDDTYYVNGPFQAIEHYGRTVPLTAYSEVEAGATYHIKLVVADASDTQFDSAVFLEAGSFDLGGTMVDLSGAELGDDELLCDLTEYTMMVNVNAPDVVYEWYLDGNLIPGENSQTYTATVSGYYEVKVTSGSCSTEVGVELTFSESPTGTDYEDFVCTESGDFTFDLSDYNPFLGSPDLIYTYYNSYNGAENELAIDEITDFQNFALSYTDSEVIVYVRVENVDGCYDIVELTLQVGIGPETVSDTDAVCDDDGDGLAVFNMEEFALENLIVSDPTGLIIEFYRDAAATDLILNPEAYTNETPNTQDVYVKIYNPLMGEDACINLEILTLKVQEFPEIQPDEIQTCDNLNDGVDFVDLTQNQIVVTEGITTTLHYFTEMGGTEITNPENFEVTSNPMIIYVLVKNEDGTCENYTELTISFMEAPEATDELVTIDECSIDNYSTYNLPSINPALVADITDLSFTYHLTFDEAFNGLNALPDNYQNTSPDQIIFARVQDLNGCFDIAEVMLDTHLVHNELEEIISVCDDPYENNDGIASFDLTQMKPSIENSLGGTEFTIRYFVSFEDALANTNAISNPAEYTNETSPQTIYSRATDGNGGCAGIVEFNIEVLEVPEFNLPDYLVFCNYDTKEYDFPQPFETYTWYDSNGTVISNNNVVAFNQEGIYTLEVTSAELSCPAMREVEVIFDNQPIITNIEVIENTIKISANGGLPPYQYSYNNGLTWTDDFVIHNVPGGIYDLIVKSKYGCISTAKTFGVLGIPNLITPNGDGRNDFWVIKGLEVYPNAHIKIFDRFGKIFVDRPLNAEFIWDGKYLGNPVAPGDYWYIISVEDGKSISGHITVRTR